MGVAVAIALISCVQAEIHAFEVCRLPSWIFPLPVQSHCSLVSLNGNLDPENTAIAVGISLIFCLEAEIHAFEVYKPSSWIFPHPVRSHSILMSPNGKLDPENIGLAVGISLIFPVWLHSLLIGTSGLLDPQYISLVAVAVGILYLSSLGVELYWHLKF